MIFWVLICVLIYLVWFFWCLGKFPLFYVGKFWSRKFLSFFGIFLFFSAAGFIREIFNQLMSIFYLITILNFIFNGIAFFHFSPDFLREIPIRKIIQILLIFFTKSLEILIKNQHMLKMNVHSSFLFCYSFRLWNEIRWWNCSSYASSFFNI